MGPIDILIQEIREIKAMTFSRWLTFAEAVKYSRRGKEWLLQKLKTGEIYGYLEKGKWIVDKQSIDDYYLQNKIGLENKFIDLKKRLCK